MATAPNPNNDGQVSLTDEKNRLAQQVMDVLNESENVWKQVSEKQLIMHQLYAEQIVVSDLFTNYHITYVNREQSETQRIEFIEVDEEVQVLSQVLTEYENKLFKAGDIIRKFIRDIRVHITGLKSSLEAVVGSKSFDDLSNVSIPNLEWIEAVPDPEVDTLADEWRQLQLETKISSCLRQMQLLIGSTGPDTDDAVVDDNVLDQDNLLTI